MPRPSCPSTLTRHDPSSLSETAREYYRTTWGFDPLDDCQPIREEFGRDQFRYEVCMPLEQDLPMQAVGITICPRVDWNGEDIHTRIVFRRGETEGIVECTHTVVYAGPAGDALTFADDHLAPETRRKILHDGDHMEKLVTLPPWEHFAALKSYVSAVADMGVIALLRQSFAPAGDPAEGLPFGFNAEMHAQVVEALFSVAPRPMIHLFKNLTQEFLDRHPPPDLVNQWFERLGIYHDPSKGLHWGFLLRYLGEPTILHMFRHTKIADKLQDRLFTKPRLLARAQAIAPDLPWVTLRLEWKARKVAKDMGMVTPEDSRLNLDHFPPAEVWTREEPPFCDYTFPRDILSPDSTSSRRSRVQAYLRELRPEYPYSPVQVILSHLDAALAAPFPADRVYVLPIYNLKYGLEYKEVLTPATVVDSIEHGSHKRRRAVVLSCPLAPELQVKFAAHWDFATRLALIGNPSTTAAVLETLTQDPQPCVRLAAAARVRRGTAIFEPLFGEMLDPGEIVWLLSSHPGIVFSFGVTTWGDGSDAYRDWFKARLREDIEQEHLLGDGNDEYRDWYKTRLLDDNERELLLGELYGWAYSEGIFLEEIDLGYSGSHLAYYGLKNYACGQLPCLYLGPGFLSNDDDVNRIDL